MIAIMFPIPNNPYDPPKPNVHINPIFHYIPDKTANINSLAENILKNSYSKSSSNSIIVKPSFANFIKEKRRELTTKREHEARLLARPGNSATLSVTNCDISIVENHFPPLIPFYKVLSKGWFSHAPCTTDCVNKVPLDLQLCCFISEKYLPTNTINIDELRKCVKGKINTGESSSVNKAANGEGSSKGESPSFFSISKHKLVRKRKPSVTTATEGSPLVFCSRRKLIRKSEPNSEIPSYPLASRMLKNKENHRVKITPNVVIRNVGTRKRLRSSTVVLTKRKLIRQNCTAEKNENVAILTKRKLVRRNCTMQNNENIGISKKVPSSIPVPVTEKSVRTVHSEKLISVSRNKLIRSTLLRKNNKHSKVNKQPSSQSVLTELIKQRRRPCAGTSYVLLTRNKLIRKVKVADKEFKKQALSRNTETSRLLNKKLFVAMGRNKLIRKTLFAKNNSEIDKPKKKSQTGPLANKVPKKLSKLPAKSVQRLTNHLVRRNLKLVRNGFSVVKNRYPNKHKINNKKLVRRKKTVICPSFRREGKCEAESKGECCSYLHEIKYVSLCKDFLKNSCTIEGCLLSHDSIINKISVCSRFLHNTCSVDNCPYLHCKPSVNAPICTQFLRGYCKLGKECANWHVYACPEYKVSSTCKKGEKCRLPHRSMNYFQEGSDNMDMSDGEDPNSLTWRYFEKHRLDGKANASISIIPERQSMGDLPDFIPI